MTSDAKIGLLLGLVFIFIIAFVINGLPRFRSAIDDESNLIDNVLTEQDQSPDIAGSVRDAPGVFDQQDEEEIALDDQTEFEQDITPDNTVEDNSDIWLITDDEDNFAMDEPQQQQDWSDYSPPQDDWAQNNQQWSDASQWDNNQQWNNAGYDDSWQTDYDPQDSVAVNQQENDQSWTEDSEFVFEDENQGYENWDYSDFDNTFLADTPVEGSYAVDEISVEEYLQDVPAEAADYQDGEVRSFISLNSTVAVDSNGGSMAITEEEADGLSEIPLASEDSEPVVLQTYIVQEGDGNLSNIAKKFYGEEEGNRIVNVRRIYEANTDVLKSIDEIFVGQEIVIPALPEETESEEESIEAESDPAIESGTAIWYVVQENDNLWDIASEQLGKGSRYTEIVSMNTDRIFDETRLNPGLRLRLPVE